MSTAVQNLLCRAEAEVGVKEEPIGSNWGKRVSEYLASVGWSKPAYWCAAFVSFCGAHEVVGWPVPKTASCDVILDWARRRGLLHTTPRAGDIFLIMASENDATHTGIVLEVNEDGTFWAIEGNSNNDGSRNGYAVVKRKRTITSRLRFVRWESAMGSPSIPVYLGSTELGTAKMIEGRAWIAARGLFTALYGPTATATALVWDADDHVLCWHGKDLPGPVEIRDGSAWTALRPPLEALGWSVTSQPDRIVIEPKEG